MAGFVAHIDEAKHDAHNRKRPVFILLVDNSIIPVVISARTKAPVHLERIERECLMSFRLIGTCVCMARMIFHILELESKNILLFSSFLCH